MKFVEGDVIHEEDDWYHGACLKIKNRDITDVCVQNNTFEGKYKNMTYYL
jgi:hypothetical protein